MTSPDQGGSGALITDHPFTPMKDHPEGCGFYPAKPHDPQGVTSSPCRWPRERHASGASCGLDCCPSKYCECRDCSTCVSAFDVPLPIVRTEGSGAGNYSNAIGALDDHTLKYSPEEAVRRVRDQDEGSGAGSTVKKWAEDEANVGLSAAVQTILKLRADLDAARSEIEALKAHATLDATAVNHLIAQSVTTRTDLARAQSRIAALERVAEASRKVVRASVSAALQPGQFVAPFAELTGLRHEIAALDAVQATAEAEQ